MRLTTQVILDAPYIINPEGNTVLQLRGLKIPIIENLGVTKDAFDVIDLVDNQLIDIKNFPKLRNLKGLLLARNNVVRISQLNLGENLPNLEFVTLVNNNIKRFSSIKGLTSCPKLAHISLNENAITEQSNYRIIMAWLIPSLKVLDFTKVKQSERERGLEIFGTIEEPTTLGKQVLEGVNKSGAEVIVEEDNKEDRDLKTVVQRLSDEEKAKLVEELESAESIEDIERIEAALRQ